MICALDRPVSKHWEDSRKSPLDLDEIPTVAEPTPVPAPPTATSGPTALPLPELLVWPASGHWATLTGFIDSAANGTLSALTMLPKKLVDGS